MTHLLVIGNWLLPLLYMALLIDYGATFFLRTRADRRTPHLVLVVALHAAWLVLRTIHLGHPPLASTQEVLSVVAWAMAAVYAIVERTGRDRRTGVFILFLVFVFQYTASMFLASAPGGAAAEPDIAGGPWSRLHVLPALVAYAAFGFAAIYGLLYLVARRDLKTRRFGVFFDRLPPLELLGRMTWHALLVGFIFMTATIATGPLMVAAGAGGAEATLATLKVEMKIITGGTAWVIYAAAILGRVLGKWHAARVAQVAVAGYIVVMALLIASALLS
jgi:ABC-type uncharacterized transport system permease subunit